MKSVSKMSKPEILSLKKKFIEDVLNQLNSELIVVEESQRNAQSNATHAESKQEGDKDMRATEASYVARGLAKRVEDLRNDVDTIKRLRCQTTERICLGALVTVEDLDEQRRKHYFVLPAGGGKSLDDNDIKYSVLTPASPIGRALLGLEKGDESLMERAGKEKTLSIVSVM